MPLFSWFLTTIHTFLALVPSYCAWSLLLWFLGVVHVNHAFLKHYQPFNGYIKTYHQTTNEHTSNQCFLKPHKFTPKIWHKKTFWSPLLKIPNDYFFNLSIWMHGVWILSAWWLALPCIHGVFNGRPTNGVECLYPKALYFLYVIL